MDSENVFKEAFVYAVRETYHFVKSCLLPQEASARGYEDGLSDATQVGKPIPKHTRTEIGMQYAFSVGERGRERFWESYHDGYNTGYTDGLRKRHEVFIQKKQDFDATTPKSSLFHQNSKGTIGMANSLEERRDAAQKLIANLTTFHDLLNRVKSAYSNKINDLEGAGLVSNFVTKFRHEKYATLNAQITATQTRVINEDIRQLEIIRDKIQSEIDKLSS